MMEPELTKEEFDKLKTKHKKKLVCKSLAWFCVYESMNPALRLLYEDECNIIKIVLGKVMNGEEV